MEVKGDRVTGKQPAEFPMTEDEFRANVDGSNEIPGSFSDLFGVALMNGITSF
jgi:hypothetical protein